MIDEKVVDHSFFEGSGIKILFFFHCIFSPAFHGFTAIIIVDSAAGNGEAAIT